MTVYSKADLRNRVLKDAEVLDIAQSASAVDAENVDLVVQHSIEQLEDEKLVIFNPQAGENIDNIPGRVFLALSYFVRSQGLSSYGIPYDEAMRLSALRMLRRSIATVDTDSPAPAEFY